MPGPRGQEIAAILQAGERVLSLSQVDAMNRGLPVPGVGGGGGRGTTVTYNVVVNGGLGTGPEIGSAIVEHIKRYERSNGSIGLRR